MKDSPADTLHHLSERLHLIGGTLWVAANLYEQGVQHKRLDSIRLSVILGMLEEILGDTALDPRHNDFVGVDLGPVLNVLAALVARVREDEDAGAPVRDDRIPRARGTADPVANARIADHAPQPGRPEGLDALLRVDQSGAEGLGGVPYN